MFFTLSESVTSTTSMSSTTNILIQAFITFCQDDMNTLLTGRPTSALCVWSALYAVPAPLSTQPWIQTLTTPWATSVSAGNLLHVLSLFLNLTDLSVLSHTCIFLSNLYSRGLAPCHGHFLHQRPHHISCLLRRDLAPSLIFCSFCIFLYPT